MMTKMRMGVLSACLLFATVENRWLFAWPANTYAKTRIIIQAGGDRVIRKTIGDALSAIVQEANKVRENMGDLATVKKLFTEAGYQSYLKLVQQTGVFTGLTEYRTNLLLTPTDKYEVRGLAVKVELGETEAEPIQELVFVLNERLFVENIHFALEKHNYRKILSAKRDDRDLLYRQQIIDFIEEYRTAHNRKDIAYLRTVYSDDALIIVGRVLEKKEGEPDMFAHSTLDQKQIQFIRLDKQKYIERLATAFQANSFVQVVFERIQIRRHHRFDEIYGIQLKQLWRSSRYEDEGYLFVLLDFKDHTRPLIQVRAWQSRPFDDGSTVSMGDFRIIETSGE